jgi:hypothetical protein
VTPLGWVFAVALTVTLILWGMAIDGALKLWAVKRARIIVSHRLLVEHVQNTLLEASGACGHGLPGLVTRKGCDCNGRSAL